jgi:hypothetical protein
MPLRAEIAPQPLRQIHYQAAKFTWDAVIADLAENPDFIVVCAFSVFGTLLSLLADIASFG